MASPDRYLLDSNIFDKLVDEPGASEIAKRAAASGTTELITTHVQADEIAATSNVARREQLLVALSLARQEPTLGFVLGYSRLGEARLSESEPFESLRAGDDRLTRTRDALISSTAQYEGATLVTEDADMRARASAAGIPAIGWDEFRRRLEAR